jgi:hypothetical protein
LRNSERKDLFKEKFWTTGLGDGARDEAGLELNGVEGMEDLDAFDVSGDWGTGMGNDGSMMSNGTNQHGGLSGSLGSERTTGLSMRKSFKSTLTRLSDGSGRRMRKTSRTSLLGDKDKESGSEPSSRPGSSQAHAPTQSISPSTNHSQIASQSQAQQRGLGIGRPDGDNGSTAKRMGNGPKDTHFFDTVAEYSGLSIPIRVPLSIFPEEVGDVSLA